VPQKAISLYLITPRGTYSTTCCPSARKPPASPAGGPPGQVVYITERGNRVAGIVPAELASILEQLSADDLDGLAAAAETAGLTAASELIEDLADRAAVLESRADPGPGIPWEQLKAEAGL
jgi:antitoxin (DNA-binding transcriptional repressor) of toxin-antitoxin stability system